MLTLVLLVRWFKHFQLKSFIFFFFLVHLSFLIWLVLIRFIYIFYFYCFIIVFIEIWLVNGIGKSWVAHAQYMVIEIWHSPDSVNNWSCGGGRGWAVSWRRGRRGRTGSGAPVSWLAQPVVSWLIKLLYIAVARWPWGTPGEEPHRTDGGEPLLTRDGERQRYISYHRAACVPLWSHKQYSTNQLFNSVISVNLSALFLMLL